MTVAMTASGAQLLLLALCACRGSTLQSAPRVRLPFKGELARIGPERLPDAFPRLLLAFPTERRLCFLFFAYVKTAFPAARQTAQHWEQKVDITCVWVTGERKKTLSPHPESDTHHDLARFMADMMTQRGNI